MVYIIKKSKRNFLPGMPIVLLITLAAVFLSSPAFTQTLGSPVRGLLVDFGATRDENVFGLPEWNSSYSQEATYSDAGPAGLRISHKNGVWVNLGIQGAEREFAEGEKIIVTWYNDFEKEQTILPRVSFDTDGYPKQGGSWYGMSKVKIPPYGTAQSVFEFDPKTSGTYSIVNITPNESSLFGDSITKIVCDKIELGSAKLDIDSLVSFPRETRTITANVYTGQGTISPSSEFGEMVDVRKGDDITFSISKGLGYTDYDLIVDGENVTHEVVNDTYTFRNVTKDHNISVGFRHQGPTVTIEATHGINGTLAPAGQLVVNTGEDVKIKYVPERNYTYTSINLDGNNVMQDFRYAARSLYWFKEIQDNHHLHVGFGYGFAKEYKTLEDLNLWKAESGRVPENTIDPGNIEYLGAFKVPDNAVWTSDGGALAYYPNGDGGETHTHDEFPGSLYAVGNPNWGHVTELSIPTPAIHDDANQLPQANELQSSAKVDDFPPNTVESETIKGLVYLQKQDKIFFGQGKASYWIDDRPNHGWFHTDLSNPQSKGLWYLGEIGENGFARYEAEDLEDRLSAAASGWLLFEIPQAWSDRYLDGKKLLATGSFGKHVMHGPHLFGIAPWDEENVREGEWDHQAGAPINGAKLRYTRLLGYGKHMNTLPENHGWGDRWRGGAWITAGERSALIFSTNMGYGTTYYNNGSAKINWNANRKVVLRLYNPQDIADVVQGVKEPYEPQPYADIDVTDYMFRSYFGEDGAGEIGGIAYDRQRNLLYLSEQDVYEETPVIHVFRIAASTYSLSVNKAGDGKGLITSTPASIHCGEVCSEEFNENTVVTLHAEAQNGSIFSGWSGAGCQGSDDCELTVNKAHTVTAVFTTEHGEVLLFKEQEPEFERGTNNSLPIVYAGDHLSYTITATNFFDEAVTLIVSDALSALVDYIADSLSVNGERVSDTHVSEEGLLEYAFVLDSQESLIMTFDTIVRNDALPDDIIENSASVTAYFIDSPFPIFSDKQSNVVHAQVKEDLVSEPVPEPGTLLLLSVGLGGVFMLSRGRISGTS